MGGISMADLELWVDGLFNVLLTDRFIVGGIQFSFWDIFTGGVVLSIFGFACGKLLFKVFDYR